MSDRRQLPPFGPELGSERQSGLVRTFSPQSHFSLSAVQPFSHFSRVPIIDAHVHLYPPEANADPVAWAEAQAEPHWATLCSRKRKDGRAVQGFPSVDELLRMMDAAGISRAILQGWYWEQPTTCEKQNGFYAACVRAHPDRLAGFAAIHPAAGPATLETMRRARDGGLIGLGELSPHSQHFALDDPIWNEALELAGSFGWPVNLHVTDPATRPYPGRVETPLADFARLAQGHAEVTFVLAHWGGGLAITGLSNVWVDTAASPLLDGEQAWRRLGGEIPADRVLFGSDYPLDLYPRTEPGAGVAPMIREIENNVADAATRKALLAGNAQRLLGWK